MVEATPDMLALARRIAADGYYPLREDQALVPYGRERILSGDMDHTVQVQTVLAAIIETTELAAKLADVHSRIPGASLYSLMHSLKHYTHLAAEAGEGS